MCRDSRLTHQGSYSRLYINHHQVYITLFIQWHHIYIYIYICARLKVLLGLPTCPFNYPTILVTFLVAAP